MLAKIHYGYFILWVHCVFSCWFLPSTQCYASIAIYCRHIIIYTLFYWVTDYFVASCSNKTLHLDHSTVIIIFAYKEMKENLKSSARISTVSRVASRPWKAYLSSHWLTLIIHLWTYFYCFLLLWIIVIFKTDRLHVVAGGGHGAC